MFKWRRFRQAHSLEQRLVDEAAKLRQDAKGTPPGIERENAIRRARQAETASRMSDWLSSPELRPPK